MPPSPAKSDTVIRHIPPSIWIFSKPFLRNGLIPVGGRSTAIKLTDGSIFLLASTPLDEETKKVIKEDMGGNVRWIAAFDTVHTMFTKDYKEEWPQARLVGPAPLEKIRKDLKWDGLFGKDPNPLSGIEDEVKAEHFKGHLNSDVVFLHVPPKTIIEADVLMNLPATEQFSKSPKSPTPLLPPSWWSALSPPAQFHKYFIWYGTCKDRREMITSSKNVSNWEFDRIIPCHGDVIETGGKTAWDGLYRWYLDAWEKREGKGK